MKDSFEMMFSGRSDNGNDFDTKMIMSGNTDIIGKLLAQFALSEARSGKPEPMRVLVAAFEMMGKLSGQEEGKIIRPKFVN